MERFLSRQAGLAAHAIEDAYGRVAKMSDEQRQAIEDIVAAYGFEQWDELIPEIQAVLETSSRAAAVEAVRQIYGPEALTEAATATGTPAPAADATGDQVSAPETGAAEPAPQPVSEPAPQAAPPALQPEAEGPAAAPQAAAVPETVAIRGFFDRVNEDAAEYSRERAAELVGRRWVDGQLVDNPNANWAITESTRERLRELVTSAFEEGMSPAQLRAAIRESDAFSKSRAQMIAHTEIGNANMQTLETASIAAGATHKRSFLSADHDHDDLCDDAAEAGEVPIDYVYIGGFTRPLYHPRCQCSESYYVRRKKKPSA